MVIGTIGHSTHPIEEFIGLLQAHGMRQLVDIRTIPRSRTNPQFNRDLLPARLEGSGIAYQHLPGLGGLRKPRTDSIHTAWRNASFRGYADHMQTAEFEMSLHELIALALAQPTAIMCAEAVHWRCHRSLVADALLVRGVEVRHIQSATRSLPHRLAPFARLEGTQITYPGQNTAVESLAQESKKALPPEK